LMVGISNLMTDAMPLGYFIALPGAVCEPG
jgi:hypothetical protein